MKENGNQLGFTIVMICVALMLTACRESMDDLEAYILAVKAKPASPIEPIPSVKTYPPYEYEGMTWRDPFRPSMSEGNEARSTTTNNGPQPDFDRSREYLERYELDTLSMVGTFRKDDSYWALVRDPEGIIHRVPEGNYIGKNHGQVVNISDSQVVLSELISDGAGGWLVREASIALGDG